MRIDGDDPQTDVYVHGHTTDVDVEGAVRHLFACAAAESVRVRAAGSVASLAVHNDDGLAECRTSETWMTIVGQPELGVLQLQRRTRVQWDLLGDLPDVERVEVVDSDVGAPVVVELSSGTEDLADVEKLASTVDAFLQAGPAVELTVYVRDDMQTALQQRFADDNVAFGAYR